MQAEDYRKVPEVGVTNPTIDVLRAHRTIRKFEDTQLGLEERDALIDVARRAPTSSFRQQFSIIHVTDVAKRDALAEVAQQPYVGTSKGDLFMFVVDLYRNARIREEAGMDIAPLQRTNCSWQPWKTRFWPLTTWRLPLNPWVWARFTSARCCEVPRERSSSLSCLA